MNLKTHIRDDLWLAIQATYEAGNYSHAILDALHHVSQVLRERAGVDGDGVSLVGQALGGNSPRLRINRLQTETERDEQKGIESILRGLYQAVRNPRSHEQVEDTQATADSVICFIDYLLGIIQKSQEPFVMATFMNRVFDPDFVNSQHYAELLVSEIPANRRFDVLVAVYREKLRGDIHNVGLVIGCLLDLLSDDQVNQYMAIVSDELSTTNDEQTFRYNIYVLPPKLWGNISEVARLRVENRVIKSIDEGQAIPGRTTRGALGTWARDHLPYFTLRDQLCRGLLEKLRSDSAAAKYYVASYFLDKLPSVLTSPWALAEAVRLISDAVRNGDGGFGDLLVSKIASLPEDLQHQLAQSLEDLTDKSNPAAYLLDGTPFLSSTKPQTDDELPF